MLQTWYSVQHKENGAYDLSEILKIVGVEAFSFSISAMTKYFIYCRKSSEEEERQMLSIEAQVTELREYAKNHNLFIAKEFHESKTAKEPGREVFNEMLAEIEKGNASGILAWNPDRLARNSVDGGKVIYLVDTGKIESYNSLLSGLRQRHRGNSCSRSPLGRQSITPTICEKTSFGFDSVRSHQSFLLRHVQISRRTP